MKHRQQTTANDTRYSWVRTSGNAKTGPIPVSVSTSNTCPKACPLIGAGCYAETSFTGLHWRKLDRAADEGKPQAIDLYTLAHHISALPHGQLWRLNVSGDLAHDNESINEEHARSITQANRSISGKGFAYTHHRVSGRDATAKHNRRIVRNMIRQGFTVNLSGNNPEHADTLADTMPDAPIVVMLEANAQNGPHLKTPAGRPIVVCPAVTVPDMDCAKCQLCAKVDRKSIVGFPVHGARHETAATSAGLPVITMPRSRKSKTPG